MNIFKILPITLLLILPLLTAAQISGNQVYGNNYNSSDRNKALQSIRTTDSTLFISTRVLMNKEPDFYFVSLGISQEGKTVGEGLNLINSRIDNLTKKLSSIGVEKEDYYVDFVSQAKIYDYKIGKQQAEQFDDGFEIKKNIIIRLRDLGSFDKLIELASEQNIFDIIKVDYRNDDVNSIYAEMYKASIELIENKKKWYLTTNTQKMSDRQRIVSDNFYSIYPDSQYKKYQAYETSDLDIYNKNDAANYLKKELRKSTTFYYSGAPISGFDKIINADNPIIGIQYFMELTMMYEITD